VSYGTFLERDPDRAVDAQAMRFGTFAEAGPFGDVALGIEVPKLGGRPYGAPLYHQLVLLRRPMSRADADHHARVAAASAR
jgi:hypothetical protein